MLCPPSAIADRWSRRFADPIPAMASGWMRVRARARQRGAELPLIISDHADWSELARHLKDVGAPKVWVTHGREEAGRCALMASTPKRCIAGREEEGETRCVSPLPGREGEEEERARRRPDVPG